MNEMKREIENLSKDFDYREKSRKFLEMNRWIGNNPVLMVVDAAGTSTGQGYKKVVVSNVEKFRDNFIQQGKTKNLQNLSELSVDNPEFKQVFSNKRKRKISIEIAKKLVEMSDSSNDLRILKDWAEKADPYSYKMDPIGEIRGVGLRTFQYLRMNAGIDTVKPDRQVRKFLKLLEDKLDTSKISTGTNIKVLESCEWICENTDLRMIDIDQIAWWYFSGNH